MAKLTKYNFNNRRRPSNTVEDGVVTVGLPGRWDFLDDVAKALGPGWEVKELKRWAGEKGGRMSIVNPHPVFGAYIEAEFTSNAKGDKSTCYLWVGGVYATIEGEDLRQKEIDVRRKARQKHYTAAAEKYGVRVSQNVNMPKVVTALNGALRATEPIMTKWRDEEAQQRERDRKIAEARGLLLSLAGFEETTTGYRRQLVIPGSTVRASLDGDSVDIGVTCSIEDTIPLVGELLSFSSVKKG